MRKVVLCLSVLLVVVLSGCTTRLTDFTVISTKNTELVHGQNRAPERVVGNSCVPVILVPIGVPNLKEAIDNAIEKAGSGYDALVDGVLYHKNQSFIFGQICYTVEGTPVSKKARAELHDKELWLHSSLVADAS